MTGGQIETWTRGSHSADGVTHPTYRKGSGPGVIVVHELPGLTSEVLAFAEEVVAAGHTVVAPHLFGKVEGPATLGQVLRVLPKVCVSREFTTLALHETSPIAGWLRSLARELHAELGGPGVGALGMCFTGGVAPAVVGGGPLPPPGGGPPGPPLPVGRGGGGGPE